LLAYLDVFEATIYIIKNSVIDASIVFYKKVRKLILRKLVGEI